MIVSLTMFVAVVPLAVSGLRGQDRGDDTRGERLASGQHGRMAAPNLLVITTDDQTLSQFAETTMPFTWRFFQRRGTVFTNAVAVPPLCCPSRAGFLTGQYPHNHHVMSNDAGYGQLVDKANTLPVWLDRAGYRTALVGKYLNGFPALGPAVPPGWDRFFAAGGIVDYFDFDVGANGEVVRYRGHRYSTNVYTTAAKRFLRTTNRRPFFLWLTYNAPHTVPDGDPPCAGTRAQPKTLADYRSAPDSARPATRALEELDVSDKGRWLRSQAPTTARHRAALERSWRCAVAALSPVDRGFSAIVRQLRRTGALARTAVVFTSDNGYFYGEHRMRFGKELPYDPALRVPLAISPPSVGPRPPATVGALVSNVDLAPTLLDYARARPCAADDCRLLDGRSLRPLLRGEAPAWTQHRALPVELQDDFDYRALRSSRHLYTELTADWKGELPRPEIELYDLREDPFQLHNLWAEDRSANRRLKSQLSARLTELTNCAGTRGPRACE